MSKKMQKKLDKYWSDYIILLSCAAVLDPRFKLERVEYCYEKLYGETYAKEMISHIRSTLFDLFDEYKGEACGSTSPTLATSLGMKNVSRCYIGCDKDQMDDILEYKMFLSKERKVDNDKSELELYLEEKNYDVMGKCDVLDYWSRNSVCYPNLACMAHDIFTIPISTVHSESAFSMGKKLINPWRASLGERQSRCLHVMKIGCEQKASH
ncbi:hypothetical protein OSB04_029095 [Centaurea solstitialis]|uniref:Uncharacterized protein n=1 Tax=Centaurea solstitialis TaxID=347529 RepID=A0AA38SIL4_9ASTR|nr:hypothetical protein OSB04_029095 [Centaurea solstitialis]